VFEDRTIVRINNPLDFDKKLHENPLAKKKKTFRRSEKSSFKMQVLLVDDNVLNLFAIRSILKQLISANFDEVFNGKEAVRNCELKDYSLIIMDCNMPIMDGFKAT
jgi:PleD family two-component response regulator